MQRLRRTEAAGQKRVMIDFTRRRFLFGLAAVPLVVPTAKHFVLPKIELTGTAVLARQDEMRRLFAEEVLSHMREHSLLYGSAFLRDDGTIVHPGLVFLDPPVTNRRT